jgi:uncharacterized Zn-binding protein involved in type VI secretion
MSGNVVRIGDSVSCGDHAAQGSSNVFCNGLPITTQSTPGTTGHGCFGPSVFVGGWSSTVFVNNSVVALLGITSIAPHACGPVVHSGTASSGSPDVSFDA